MARLAFCFLFFLALLSVAPVHGGESCPAVVIEGPKSGKISVTAPAHCDGSTLFTCKTGTPRSITRIRSGKNIHQGYCVEPEQRTITKEQADIDEANARGISLKTLYDQRAKSDRREVVSGPDFMQTELSRTLTQNAPLTVTVASDVNQRSFNRMQVPSDLHKAAKKAGVPDVVLERAFENFKQETLNGNTKRPCFMAGDLTTPKSGKMWILCVTNPPKVISIPTEFARGRGPMCRDNAFYNAGSCAKYFSNKQNSCLPVGGRFITSVATRGKDSDRNLIGLKGLEGFNKNTADRGVGIHRAEVDGEESIGSFVIPQKLNGFSDTDLSASHSGKGMALYVYPSPSDIKDLVDGKPAYWNSECLSEIKKPAWVDKDGNSHYDSLAIEKEQSDFIKSYYQEPMPKVEDRNANPRPVSPVDSVR